MATENKDKAPKPEPIIMTQSRMMDFLTCERLEWFRYRAGGCGIEVIVPETFYLEGEFGHYALAHWYMNAAKGGLMLRQNMIERIEKTIDDLGEITPEYSDELKQKMAAMIGACYAYKEKYKPDLKRYKFILIEKEFEIEIAGVIFRGKLDLGVEDREDGKRGFWEHKFLQQYSADDYDSLPLNLQQLIYTLAFKALTGKLPDWYMWNVIKKSALRRKGTTAKKDGSMPIPESWVEFESRVQAQYMEEQDKMFCRPPPRKIEAKPLESLAESVAYHIGLLRKFVESEEMPPMRYCSCQGRYGKPCPYSKACQAAMAGHGQGWNAPECRGLFRKKLVQHPELEDK